MEAIKQQLCQVLDQRGVLSRLKAELRATVFLAINEQDIQQGGAGLGSRIDAPRRDALLAEPSGVLLVELVLELLHWCKCACTLQVLEPELQLPQLDSSRSNLAQQLGLGDGSSISGPLLLELLQQHLSTAACGQAHVSTLPCHATAAAGTGAKPGAPQAGSIAVAEAPAGPKQQQQQLAAVLEGTEDRELGSDALIGTQLHTAADEQEADKQGAAGDEHLSVQPAGDCSDGDDEGSSSSSDNSMPHWQRPVQQRLPAGDSGGGSSPEKQQQQQPQEALPAGAGAPPLAGWLEALGTLPARPNKLAPLPPVRPPPSAQHDEQAASAKEPLPSRPPAATGTWAAVLSSDSDSDADSSSSGSSELRHRVGHGGDPYEDATAAAGPAAAAGIATGAMPAASAEMSDSSDCGGRHTGGERSSDDDESGSSEAAARHQLAAAAGAAAAAASPPVAARDMGAGGGELEGCGSSTELDIPEDIVLEGLDDEESATFAAALRPPVQLGRASAAAAAHSGGTGTLIGPGGVVLQLPDSDSSDEDDGGGGLAAQQLASADLVGPDDF